MKVRRKVVRARLEIDEVTCFCHCHDGGGTCQCQNGDISDAYLLYTGYAYSMSNPPEELAGLSDAQREEFFRRVLGEMARIWADCLERSDRRALSCSAPEEFGLNAFLAACEQAFDDDEHLEGNMLEDGFQILGMNGPN